MLLVGEDIVRTLDVSRSHRDSEPDITTGGANRTSSWRGVTQIDRGQTANDKILEGFHACKVNDAM